MIKKDTIIFGKDKGKRESQELCDKDGKEDLILKITWACFTNEGKKSDSKECKDCVRT